MYRGIIVCPEDHKLGQVFYHSLNKNFNNPMHIEEATDVLYSYRTINELLKNNVIDPIVFIVVDKSELYLPLNIFKKRLPIDVKVHLICEDPSLLHCLARDTTGFTKAVPSLNKSDCQSFCDRVKRYEARLGCAAEDLIACIDLESVLKHPDNTFVFGVLADTLTGTKY
ncbi:MAG: hypothetical protein LBD23_03050 [Oscillospiraceae bacterium]|jgi:hypothetical protein|nr:hypothetical protein [Oscillospiraceae bacterium]